MFFMILNAVVSAIFFVLVVVPPLFIYDPVKNPGESHGPPIAGEIISGEDVSHSVKQKLYLLFVIPACAMANALFLYFTYYRPIRGVQYRVEMNVMALFNQRVVARQQLQSTGFTGVPAATSTFNFTKANNSFLHLDKSGALPSARSNTFRPATASTHGDANGATDLRMKTDYSRRARPKNVSPDSYLHSSFYPEVKRLMAAVEDSFFTPAAAAQKNFAKAVSRLTGEAPPGVAKGPMLMSGSMPSGFYSSQRTSGVTGAMGGPGGIGPSGAHGSSEGTTSSGAAHEPVAGRVPAMGRRHANNSFGDEMQSRGPHRNTSVVLLLSDRNPGRRSSGSGHSGARRGFAGSPDIADHDPLDVDSGMSTPSGAEGQPREANELEGGDPHADDTRRSGRLGRFFHRVNAEKE